MTGAHLLAFWHPVVDFCCSGNCSGKGHLFNLFSYCKVGRQKHSYPVQARLDYQPLFGKGSPGRNVERQSTVKATSFCTTNGPRGLVAGFASGLAPKSFPKPCRSINMAAEEEWYFEEEGCLQFSGRPISVTFSPASNCFICTLEDGTIEVVDARSSLRLKRTSTAGLYDEMKHVILI